MAALAVAVALAALAALADPVVMAVVLAILVEQVTLEIPETMALLAMVVQAAAPVRRVIPETQDRLAAVVAGAGARLAHSETQAWLEPMPTWFLVPFLTAVQAAQAPAQMQATEAAVVREVIRVVLVPQETPERVAP